MENFDAKRLWKEGTIGIPTKDKNTDIAHYWAKVYDEPSVYGINEGRISKLRVTINGKEVIAYDRGWDLEPEDDNQSAQIALAILLDQYN